MPAGDEHGGFAMGKVRENDGFPLDFPFMVLSQAPSFR